MSGTTPTATGRARTYRIGELFAGAGGMALGAHDARIGGSGFRHVWATDIDDDACSTFRRNLAIEPDRVLCSPVDVLDFDSLDPIDGLAFGFPCNDFSMVGERKGARGEFGALYRWGVKALEVLRPPFFVAENVSGLRSTGGRRDFTRILRELGDAGYDTHHHLYRFEEYGLPQARHRIIVVGFRKDLGLSFSHASPNGRRRTCRDALANIPRNAANQEATRHPRSVVERLEHIRPGENAFTADLPARLRLNLKSGAKISLIYRRLKADAPSYTITGSGGGGTHVYHWDEPRALTNRERARLQTFPDWFTFMGGKESVRRQVGMALPPEGSRIVFSSVLQTLLEHDVPVGA